MRLLIYLAAFALIVYSLSHCFSVSAQDRGGAPKWVWTIIILIPGLGSLIWFMFYYSKKQTAKLSPQQPLAPDDDPDFLWRLAQENRRNQEPQKPQNPQDPQDPEETDNDNRESNS